MKSNETSFIEFCTLSSVYFLGITRIFPLATLRSKKGEEKFCYIISTYSVPIKFNC